MKAFPFRFPAVAQAFPRALEAVPDEGKRDQGEQEGEGTGIP